VSDLRDKLDVIADASPAPTGAQRDREIQQAITRGLATPAREARRVWPWIVIGTSVAAAAAIAILVVGIGRARENDGPGSQIASTHDAGVVAIDADRIAIAPDALVVDDVLVEAKPDTKYKRDGRAMILDEGELVIVDKGIETTALEVTTPEARLVVDKARLVGGARFVVGRYASQTVIRVEIGEVLVTPTDGEPVTVRAGESWPTVDPDARDAGVAKTDRDGRDSRDGRDGRDGRDRDAGVRVPVLVFDATIIRKTIRAGKVGDAREMIEAGRSAHASSKRAMAELGILAAEADLAERKTKSAIGKYLDVVRDYASTAQAEQALFAAAQLAIDRPDAGYKAEALLRDYLDTYPKGQFAKDAARLLETLKK
jgi:hypothetical protein